jgi:uncharacterized delta-60 repeat protein
VTHRRRIGMTLLVAGALVALGTSVSAAPGDLDSSFDDDGVATTIFRDSYGVAKAVAVQPDGKVVVAGSVHRNATIQADFALARYTTSGRLDRTFDRNGRVRTDFRGRFEDALAVAVQRDGKILAAGGAAAGSGDGMAIARYDADGTLDRSFSRNGKRVINVGIANVAYDIALEEDGDVVLAGTDGEDFVLLRLGRDGNTDRGFGDNGVVRTNFNGFYDVARAVAIAPDGSIVAGGSAQNEVSRTDFALARYDDRGALVGAFGHGGLVTTDFASYEDAITDLVLDPNGDIIASGSAGEFPGGADQSTDVALARYEANGAPDTSFGEGGTVRTDFGSYFDQAEGMALDPEGRIIVASHRYDQGSTTAAVGRYEADGDLDSTFGRGGIADSGAEVSGDNVGGVALQADGRIVVATGASTGNPAASFGYLVARFLASRA